MKCISIDHVLLQADSGCSLQVALREAVALAFTENRDAVLRFNDKEYTVDVEGLLANIETNYVKAAVDYKGACRK